MAMFRAGVPEAAVNKHGDSRCGEHDVLDCLALDFAQSDQDGRKPPGCEPKSARIAVTP